MATSAVANAAPVAKDVDMAASPTGKPAAPCDPRQTGVGYFYATKAEQLEAKLQEKNQNKRRLVNELNDKGQTHSLVFATSSHTGPHEKPPIAALLGQSFQTVCSGEGRKRRRNGV
eukprot:Selendium_serpulae@DN6416_c0_g2_i7.p1